MKELMWQIMSNNRLVLVISGTLIFALTQLLKMPIKHFTNKIKNERLRRIVNITIMFIPFALGAGLEFAYSAFIYHDAFNLGLGFAYGTFGVSVYSFVERFLKVKIPNPFETKEGKAVLEFIDAIGEDGKIDEKDSDAIQAFWDKVK